MIELLLEMNKNVGFIAETEEILEIANELIEDGVTVYFDYEGEFEDMIDNNSILQITKIICECEDCGKVKYFIEEVFDEDGYTIPDDELVITYIDETLLDCIEYTALDTEIIPVDIEYIDDEDEEIVCDGDCANCELSEDEFEDEDFEDLGYTLTDELLSSLSEIDSNDVESIVEMIADKLNEAFEMGYQEGIEISLEEIKDTFEAVKSLK